MTPEERRWLHEDCGLISSNGMESHLPPTVKPSIAKAEDRTWHRDIPSSPDGSSRTPAPT